MKESVTAEESVSRLMRRVFEAWGLSAPLDGGRVLSIYMPEEEIIAMADYAISCPEPDKT